MENIIYTTKDQLESLIKSSIKEALAENQTANNTDDSLGDYIEEKKAIQLFGRKTTWFWNMRTAGKLPFTKVGSKIFYSKADLISLMDSNKK